ncbi:MAG: hypothetical protein QXL47_00700 [Candidatus Anstonellales archaeon]
MRENNSKVKIKALELAKLLKLPGWEKEILECLQEDPDVDVKIAALSALAEIGEGRTGFSSGYIKSINPEAPIYIALEGVAYALEASSQQRYEKLEGEAYKALVRLLYSSKESIDVINECLYNPTLLPLTCLIIASDLKNFEHAKNSIKTIYNTAIENDKEIDPELLIAYYLLYPEKIKKEELENQDYINFTRIFNIYMDSRTPENIASLCLMILTQNKMTYELIENWIKLNPNMEESARLKALTANMQVAPQRPDLEKQTIT